MNTTKLLLTPQEREVLLALVVGSSNRAMADALALSVKTVETYLTRIYRKVGCSSRAELLVAYYTGSIVDFPSVAGGQVG